MKLTDDNLMGMSAIMMNYFMSSLLPDYRFGNCVRMSECVQIYCMVQVGTKTERFMHEVTQEFFNKSCLMV